MNYQLPNSPLNRLRSHWPRALDDQNGTAAGAQKLVARAVAWRRRLERFLGDHPQATVVVAAAVGIALGWLVKRK